VVPNAFGLNSELGRLNAIVWGSESPAYEPYPREANADHFAREITSEQLALLIAEGFVSNSFQDLRGLPSLEQLGASLKRNPNYRIRAVVLVDKNHARVLWTRVEPLEIDELPSV